MTIERSPPPERIREPLVKPWLYAHVEISGSFCRGVPEGLKGQRRWSILRPLVSRNLRWIQRLSTTALRGIPCLARLGEVIDPNNPNGPMDLC